MLKNTISIAGPIPKLNPGCKSFQSFSAKQVEQTRNRQKVILSSDHSNQTTWKIWNPESSAGKHPNLTVNFGGPRTSELQPSLMTCAICSPVVYPFDKPPFHQLPTPGKRNFLDHSDRPLFILIFLSAPQTNTAILIKLQNMQNDRCKSKINRKGTESDKEAIISSDYDKLRGVS